MLSKIQTITNSLLQTSSTRARASCGDSLDRPILGLGPEDDMQLVLHWFPLSHTTAIQILLSRYLCFAGFRVVSYDFQVVAAGFLTDFATPTTQKHSFSSVLGLFRTLVGSFRIVPIGFPGGLLGNISGVQIRGKIFSGLAKSEF